MVYILRDRLQSARISISNYLMKFASLWRHCCPSVCLSVLLDGPITSFKRILGNIVLAYVKVLAAAPKNLSFSLSHLFNAYRNALESNLLNTKGISYLFHFNYVNRSGEYYSLELGSEFRIDL